MTVAELMAVLAGFDPAIRVVIDGYESGLDDVLQVDAANIRADSNLVEDQDWFGRHLVDEVSPTETAVWIKGRQPRGNNVTVQSLAAFEDHLKDMKNGTSD